jgi:hypothetical protein
MLFAKPLEPLEAEAYQPALVGDYQVLHVSRLDAVHYRDELLPRQIQATASQAFASSAIVGSLPGRGRSLSAARSTIRRTV